LGSKKVNSNSQMNLFEVAYYISSVVLFEG